VAAKPEPRILTDLQKAWAKEYIGGSRFNASAAAASVGMSESEGRRIRALPHIVDYIEMLQAERLASAALKGDRVLAEMIALAFSDMADIVRVEDGRLIVSDFENLPRTVTTAIKKIKLRRSNKAEGDFDEVLELELHDKLGPLTKLFEYLGLAGEGADAAHEKPKFTGLTLIGPGGKSE
jgi:hypothetical protein